MSKGHTNNPHGRPKGAPNKATSHAREAIAAFVDGNAERLNKWLDEIYEQDGPKDAFNCFTSLFEYHVPKLARNEVEANIKGTLNVLINKLDADNPPS